MNQSTVSNHHVNSKISPWLVRLVYPLGSRIVVPLFFGRLTITGEENIPKTGPVIVAPTHRSRWDALIVPYSVGRRTSGRDLRFMVTSSEMKGIQGWFISRMGGFPIDVKHPGMSTLGYSVTVLKQGEMLVIFPEGGIFRDTQVHPLKRGVAKIALEVQSQQPDSGMKILPVSIHYSQPLPSWGTDVTVNIGQPIDIDSYDTQKIRSSSETLTDDLESSLKEVHQGKNSSQELAIA
ncbi:MAG: 1-acyl-sn-glycerol-3-phosphate acyltransferase [Cyanobacteria bacterium P01_G01_bin.49]